LFNFKGSSSRWMLFRSTPYSHPHPPEAPSWILAWWLWTWPLGNPKRRCWWMGKS
jgi:hypothetical protein